jgi:tetratricopeptide (TPR) repeat protein
MVAQDLREYEEARKNYQQALAIYVEFGDRYSQANTYGQLGLLAKAEDNLTEASQNLLQALAIFAQFKDQHSVAITLRNLAQLYQSTQDSSILETIAQLFGTNVEEVLGALETE